ncbi:hypothetical protein [Kribbella capetownensis]|uniref:hypothetical protein n=1 Tax=Kribbella capetownensis TaxID=1572659 RepID=UPI00192D4517|nr:hypothetical protein [Kribbella capetownensis]
MNTMQRQARLFRLVRHADVSGVRGTGTLAEGVEWSDGTVALRWRGRWPGTSTWDGGIEALLAVHGAGGRTQVHWFPAKPARATTTAAAQAVWSEDPVETVWLPAPGLDGRCSRCGQLWPCLSCGP